MSNSHKVYEAAFPIGDRVFIDGDTTLHAVVTAVLWRVERPQVECSWFHNGDSRCAWIEQWRLEKATEK